MEQEIKKANRYRKRGELEKAIKEYEKYIKNKKGNNPNIIVAYVNCLRKSGSTKKAQDVLESSISLQPENEVLLNEYFNYLDNAWRWEDANIIARKLIEVNPYNSEHYFKLGKGHSVLKEHEKALSVFKKGLEIKHRMSFEELLTKIESGITPNYNEVSSIYKHIGGKNNYGVIIHNYNEKKYITKITEYKTPARREEMFYKEIQQDFPKLKEITPKFINSKIYDKLLYLTVEIIESSSSKELNIQKVIESSKKISSIYYRDAKEKYSNPYYSFHFKNRPVIIVNFFTNIHKKSINKKLLTSLKRELTQKNYPQSLKKLINELEKLIMQNKLFLFINPEKDYSLLHGDFIPSNMKEDIVTEEVKVFDWATFKLGPRFLDILKFFSKKLSPYVQVKELYLFNDTNNENLSIIEKIFFLYAYIILYFVTLNLMDKVTEENIEKYLTPALKDLNILVEDLKKDGFFIKLKRIEDERRKLVIENRKLRNENKKNKIQINKIKNSSYWKITSPLRKVVKFIKSVFSKP